MNPGNFTKQPRPRSARWLIARRTVQCAFLVLFPLPLLASGWLPLGLTTGGDQPLATAAALPFFGSLTSSVLFGFDLLDPYSALQVMAASRSISGAVLLAALPILVLYALIRGRVFCGWVCPVNLVLEGVDSLRSRLGLQVKETVMPRHAKIWIALGVLLGSALVSIPLFEAVSPVSVLNRGLLFGSTAGLLTLVAIVLVELFWGHRVWCRAFCPLGGFYQVVGRVGLVNIHFDDEACTQCKNCKAVCIADPQILDPVLDGCTDAVLAGDCMLCGKCIDVCPTKALSVRPGLEHFQCRGRVPVSAPVMLQSNRHASG